MMEMKSIGVTPAKEKQFAKKGVFTPEDVIKKLTPRSFLDISKLTGVLPEDKLSCIEVIGKNIRESYGRISTLRFFGVIKDTEEKITVTFFNQSYKHAELSKYIGKTFILVGHLNYNFAFQTYECQSPVAIGLSGSMPPVKPVYPKVPGMSEEYLIDKIKKAWEMRCVPPELFTAKTREGFKILSIEDMYRNLHFPKTIMEASAAKEQLQLYEFINFAYKVERSSRNAAVYSPFQITTKALKDKVLKESGFEPTEGQAKCLKEIEELIQSGRRLNGIVLANVGAGKTFLCQLVVADIIGGGGQAVVMAPTSALAKQHFSDFKELFEPLGIHIAFLASDTKGKEKKKVLEEIRSGAARIVTGTHSLISDDVIYKDLRLAVIDEEQRFGVEQKDKLINKGQPGCHSLMLTATPIPKTLTAVLHGNIQQYEIHSMPKGRLPILTGVAKAQGGMTARERTARFICKQVQAGHQAYIVCPMIEDNDSMDGVLSIEEASGVYHGLLDPYGVKIETLTGRDKKEDIDAVMQRFKDGDVDVLLCTTVVEVGINNPNATVMVIENAERFGLSQLHQLRGRVGRSNIQTYCVLISQGGEENPRLKALCESGDGFYLAEKDLDLRGGGDIVGNRQSGGNRMIGLIMENREMYEKARKIANYLLDTVEEPKFGELNESEEENAG